MTTVPPTTKVPAGQQKNYLDKKHGRLVDELFRLQSKRNEVADAMLAKCGKFRAAEDAAKLDRDMRAAAVEARSDQVSACDAELVRLKALVAAVERNLADVRDRLSLAKAEAAFAAAEYVDAKRTREKVESESGASHLRAINRDIERVQRRIADARYRLSLVTPSAPEVAVHAV